MSSDRSDRTGHGAGEPLITARGVSLHHGSKLALDDVSFTIGKGRIVGLLGHNGAGKTTLMKSIVGLADYRGSLSVLGLAPREDRVSLLESLCWIPDVAVLPRWARVDQLIAIVGGLHPRFSAERARKLLQRTRIGARDRVSSLSRGMVVQLHLALTAAIDARLMVLDEPTLGLDVLSRRAFYELLLEAWCDGERSVLISTHQVEEIEALLSDVLVLSDGRLVLDTRLADIERRFVAIAHQAHDAAAISAARPLLRYRQQGRPVALFDGEPPPEVAALGDRLRPQLVDLFVALTRQPESTAALGER